MSSKDDKSQDSAESSFKNSMEWREKFAEFLQEERKKKAGVRSADQMPRPGTQRQAESKKDRSVNDIDYVIRFLMWLFSMKDHETSSPRLRCLAIAWFLAKMEYTTELSSFQGAVAEDYVTEFAKEFEYNDKTSSEEIFGWAWAEYGSKVQGYVQRVLGPLYDTLLAEAEAVPVAEPEPTAVPEGLLPTLDMFPEKFQPLHVIVGGYDGDINKEPEHIHELFRQSQNLVNLHYLPSLGLGRGTQIISDQLFIELGEDERANEVLGNSHLLVVGGPLVNAVSRHLALTKQLVFNFAYDNAAYRWGPKVYDFLTESGLFKSSLAVKMFYRMLKTPHDKLDLRKPEFVHALIDESVVEQIKGLVLKIRHDLMGNLEANNFDISERFRPKMIFSPLDLELRNCQSNSGHERAIISLGENPWAKDLRKKNPEHPRYALIHVAGINNLSTTVALRALGEKGNFATRPLGGLLDVREENTSNKFKRVTTATYTWLPLTPSYEIEDILTNVDKALGQTPDERPTAFTLFDDEQLASYKELVEQFLSDERLLAYRSEAAKGGAGAEGDA